MCGETYRVYEHIIGLPDYLDTIVEALEEVFYKYRFSADEAERFIENLVTDKDRYGRKRKIYVYRLGGQNGTYL